MAQKSGGKMDPAQVQKAYMSQLAKSPAPPAVKARAKNFEKLLLEKAENLSEADKLKVCNFLANGGLP